MLYRLFLKQQGVRLALLSSHCSPCIVLQQLASQRVQPLELTLVKLRTCVDNIIVCYYIGLYCCSQATRSPTVSQYLVQCHLTEGHWGVPMAIVTMHAFVCDYAHLCHAVSLQLCLYKHVICTFMLCSQLPAITCACDYVHLCHAVSLQLCTHEHVTMHIYGCDYAFYSSSHLSPVFDFPIQLSTFMLCSQLQTKHAFACDYEHLCSAIRLEPGMHKHGTMHIYAMQSASSYYMCM